MFYYYLGFLFVFGTLVTAKLHLNVLASLFCLGLNLIRNLVASEKGAEPTTNKKGTFDIFVGTV